MTLRFAKCCCILVVLFLFSAYANAQKFTLKNYGLSYRWFQMETFGNNPTTVAPLLKDPAPYQQKLNSIHYNSLYGNPGVISLHTLYVNAEWRITNPASRFWKTASIHTGLLMTTKINVDAGAVAEDSRYTSSTDHHEYRYSLKKHQQFLGLLLGLNKRKRLSNKFQFMYGINGQMSICATYRYGQQLDTTIYSPTQGVTTKSTRLSDLKAKNFSQWQLYVPLGIEYFVYKTQLSVRAEFIVGVTGNKYLPHSYSSRESNGLGVTVSYWPQKKLK